MNLKKLGARDAHSLADTLLKTVNEIRRSDDPSLKATADEFAQYHRQLNDLADSGNFAGQILGRLKSAKIFTKKHMCPLPVQAETTASRKKTAAIPSSTLPTGSVRTIRVPSLVPTSASDIPSVRTPTLAVDNVGTNASRSPGVSRPKQAA